MKKKGEAQTGSECDGAVQLERANALLSQRQFEEALAAFREVVREHPELGAGYFGLGAALRNLGNVRDAAAAYQTSARLQPNSFASHFNAGVALYMLRDFASAQPCFERAVALNGDSADAHRLFGVCLAQAGTGLDAIKHLRKAAALAPHNAVAWYDLGNALRDTGNVAEALSCYERALKIDARYTEAAANLGELLGSMGEICEALALYRGVLKRDPHCSLVVSNTLLYLNYDPGIDRETLFAEHKRLVEQCYQTQQEQRAIPVRSATKGRLRIGYVSPDFRCHSVAYFVEGILKSHDRSRFDIYCYSNVERPDEKTAQFRQMALWRDIARMDDRTAAELVRSDDIDILVDLAGHTAGNRLGLFAQRAAPVQVTYVGYPNTTGLRTMDFRISDWNADPKGMDTLYTEKLVRLPKVFLCYTPPLDAPVPADISGRRNKAPTFGSFNNAAKISGETLSAWSQILAAMPDACLLLKSNFLDNASVAERLNQRLRQHEIDPGRVELVGRIDSTAGHLAAYERMDVALDTFPYNGTTTTCEALWMGVPVVTFEGDRHAGRVGAGFLKATALDEFVGHTDEEYVGIATRVARDRDGLAALRLSLRQRISSSAVCDSATFTRELEEAYCDMWKMKTGGTMAAK